MLQYFYKFLKNKQELLLRVQCKKPPSYRPKLSAISCHNSGTIPKLGHCGTLSDTIIGMKVIISDFIVKKFITLKYNKLSPLVHSKSFEVVSVDKQRLKSLPSDNFTIFH